jgi:hypothetical protein
MWSSCSCLIRHSLEKLNDGVPYLLYGRKLFRCWCFIGCKETLLVNLVPSNTILSRERRMTLSKRFQMKFDGLSSVTITR